MSSLFSPLLAWTDRGLYCQSGDFYIDPHKPVKNAVITHAHSDHARRGCQTYYSTEGSLGLLKVRLGKNISIKTFPYQRKFYLNGIEVSFHSAGHILGSAQVRIQSESEVWVVSGDYKREPDPSCDPFELVTCDTFITEATFGTPKYCWDKGRNHGKEISDWWKETAKSGKNCLLFGYSLGKAQRILAELAPFVDRPVYIHTSMHELTQCYRDLGWKLAETLTLGSTPSPNTPLQGALIIAPPSVLKTDLIDCLGSFETAFASGWMQSALNAHGTTYDRGFILSDHADWNDLNLTVHETQARNVFVLHRNGALIRHLRKKGINAHPIESLTNKGYQDVVERNLTLF